MQITFRLAVPAEARAELTIEGTVGEMQRLADQIAASPKSTHHPLCVLHAQIREVIAKAEDRFQVTEDAAR